LVGASELDGLGGNTIASAMSEFFDWATCAE